MSGAVTPPPSPSGPPGAVPSQGQPPIGSSPATGPTQNLGAAAKGMQAVGAILNGMAMIIPLVGAGTPVGQALAKAMVDIGKHVQPGAASPQGDNEFVKQMALRNQRMGSQQAAVASQMPPRQMPPPGGAPPAAAV